MASMQGIGFPELVVLGVLALLLFGGKHIPAVARGLAEGLSNLRGGPARPLILYPLTIRGC